MISKTEQLRRERISTTMKGIVFTTEHRGNISEARKNSNYVMPLEIKKKISIGVKKVWLDGEYRQNQISKHIGFKQSTETLIKRVNSMKNWHKNNKNTKEYKKIVLKISIANKGRKLSEEHKRKISEVNKGKKISEEHREKIRNSMLGNKKLKRSLKKYFRDIGMSEETKKKMSLANIGKKYPVVKYPHFGMRGKKLTAKHRKKISKSQMGENNSVHLPGVRKKMSMSIQGILDEKDWKGFIKYEPYDENFNYKFKKEIRKHYNFTCVLCNKKYKRTLSVHHIDYNKKNSTINNCIPLCGNCHSKTHHNREYWCNKLKPLVIC